MKGEKEWNAFLEFCSKTHSLQELRKVFDLFLTIEEKEMLASRFLIVQKLFRKRLSQRKIAETLGVSISQITRGSNALKMIDEEIKKFLNKNM